VNAQHPLSHRLADHWKTADLALAIDHFFVGEDCPQLGAPVHRRFGDKREPLAVTVSALLFFARGFRRIWERLDRLRFVCRRVEPRIVKLQENPLRPLEIFRVGRVDLARPIVAEALVI
jgi:hypothetical protein